MNRNLTVVAVGLALLCAGCAAPTVYDSVYDDGLTHVAGAAAVVATTPPAAVGQSWIYAHEQKAEDITLADLPLFALGLTDPTQVLPPPFGTFYAPWKIFVTVVKSFPFVTYSKAGENTDSATFFAGQHAGPLWYAVGPGIEDLDSYAAPVRETVAADHTPVPTSSSYGDYWQLHAEHQFASLKHAGYTLKYLFLNTNSDLPPYDNFYPDQLSRDKTTIHKTFDTFLFGFDWDDPYVN